MTSESEFLVRPADRSHETPSAISSPRRKNQRRKRRRSKTQPETDERPNEPVADADGASERLETDNDERDDGVDYYA